MATKSKVDVEKMASTIMEKMEEYASLVADDMKEAVKETSRQVRKEIAANAPVHAGAYTGKSSSGKKHTPGDYKKGWTATKTEETATTVEYVVRNKTHYQLAHLLENGHALRQGGRTRAYPHIAPAEENGETTLNSLIEEAIKSNK